MWIVTLWRGEVGDVTLLRVPVSDVSAWQHLISVTQRFWWFRDAGSAHSVHEPFCDRLVALELSTNQVRDPDLGRDGLDVC